MKLDYSVAWTDAMTMLRGQRELLFTLAGALLFLPALAVEVFAPFRTDAQTLELFGEDLNAYLSGSWPLLLVTSLVTALGQATILALLLDPKRPTVREALGAGLSMLPLFFLLSVLVKLIWAAGFMLLIIPGFYLIGRTVLAPTAMIAEKRRNPFDALRRSLALTRGNGWAVFFMVAVIWVVGMVLAIAVARIFGIVGALAGGASLAAFVSAFFSSLLGAALMLVLLLVYISFYRQLSAERSVSVN